MILCYANRRLAKVLNYVLRVLFVGLLSEKTALEVV